MLKINKVESCYGLQNNKRIISVDFKRSSRSKKKEYLNLNYVYGINMSGKSSLVRVFKSLKQQISITNNLRTDGNADVDIDIDSLNITYNASKWTNSDIIKDRLFIYDKQFIDENYTVIEKTGYIGIDASEYYNSINMQQSLVPSASEIKRNAQKLSYISNKGDFLGFGNNLKFKSFYSTGNVPFESLINEYGKTDNVVFSISDNDIEKNHNLLINDKIETSIIDTIVSQIDMFVKGLGNKYNIKNQDSLSFYQTVKNYLFYNQVDVCPICLRQFESNNDRESIIEQIENDMKIFINNDAFMNITKRLAKYNSIDAALVDDFKDIVHRLTSEDGYVTTDEIEKFKSKVKSFYAEVDNYLCHKITMTYSSNIIEYNRLELRKKEIYNQNVSITNSKLFDKFNELLISSAFPLSNIVQASLDKEQPFIKITIKDSDDSLKSYFNKNASEGEKSLLSILYYFAVVLTSSISKDNIICIIDDPIDSHNNQNKYFIMDFVANNLITHGLFNIIFTHSAEVIKFSKVLSPANTKIYLITDEHKNGIFELRKEHYKVFDGLYEFFKEAVVSKSKENTILKSVSLVTVLRDYVSQTKIFTENLIHKNTDGTLLNHQIYKELSNRAIHFNPLDDYISIKELIDLYEKYIDKFKIPTSQIEDYDKYQSYKINDYITTRLAYKEYDVENLSMNIMFKNLLALKIRKEMEKLIYDFTIQSLTKNKNSFINKYTDKDHHTLGSKISLINEEFKTQFNDINQSKWINISRTINKQKAIVNSYHHLANSYVTPMFEIKLSHLEQYSVELAALRKECID